LKGLSTFWIVTAIFLVFHFHAALDLAANPGGSHNLGDLFSGCSDLPVRDQVEADFQTLERPHACNDSLAFAR
jgi:hypothetical protein